MKRAESGSFGLDYLPSTASKQHQQGNDHQRHDRGMNKKDLAPSHRQTQNYDNLENMPKGKRKSKTQPKVRMIPFREDVSLLSNILISMKRKKN